MADFAHRARGAWPLALLATCVFFAVLAAPAAADPPRLGDTDSGPLVNLVQRELRRLNLYLGPVDGQYTSATAAAVRLGEGLR